MFNFTFFPFSDQWLSGYVTIAEDTTKLQFVAIHGGETSSEVQGDIALDDLVVRRGPCSLYTTVHTTTYPTTDPTNTGKPVCPVVCIQQYTLPHTPPLIPQIQVNLCAL